MFPPEKPSPQFPYQVLEQVGIGSMGIVYRAVEVDLDRTVAIKILRPSTLAEEPPEVQQEMRLRFLQEAQAAGRISHPGVTVVYRVGQEASIPFMVMEWLEGDTLEERLGQRGRLMPVEAAKLAANLLEALEAAHRAGVVHRDIKPSNLVLLDNGRLKVTDFGIARIQGRDLVTTQAGVVLATPKFASPEQLRGVDVDGRADIFSAGVLLYLALSGQYPFEGRGFMELANAILQNEPVPLRQLVSDLPARLDAIVHLALRKEREDRYRSAAKMAEDLRAYLAEVATGTVEIVGSEAEPAVDPSTGATVGENARPSPPIVRGLPHEPGLALVEVAKGWPGRSLEKQAVHGLLDRLLERPLHADPFAGALLVDHHCLLVENGVLLGAIDTRSGETGDVALAHLPESATPQIHPLPDHLPPGTVSVLASALYPPRLLHANLDSSFIHLPGLAQKLHDERFDGLLRFLHGSDWGLVVFVGGTAVTSLYSEGWSRVPIDQTWQRWVSDHPVRAQAEQRRIQPSALWFRRAFADLRFDIARVDDEGTSADRVDNTSSSLRQLFSASRTGPSVGRLVARPARTPAFGTASGLGIQYERAHAARFLDWLVRELPSFLAERDLSGRWKYLAEWIFEIRNADLYHELPRPGKRRADFFDLVTYDSTGKVLHLAHRLDHATPESFAALHERVVGAKLARKKTGDVGGAFYVARELDEAILDSYRQALATASSGSWFGMEESFTGYEGFVRVGPRRGFHLLLVRETDEGFEPIFLPPA